MFQSRVMLSLNVFLKGTSVMKVRIGEGLENDLGRILTRVVLGSAAHLWFGVLQGRQFTPHPTDV